MLNKQHRDQGESSRSDGWKNRWSIRKCLLSFCVKKVTLKPSGEGITQYGERSRYYFWKFGWNHTFTEK